MKAKWNTNEVCKYFENKASNQNITELRMKAKKYPRVYEPLHDVSLALQTLYYQCANCRSQTILLEFLKSAIQNPPKISQAFDHVKFESAWIDEAKQLFDDYSK